MRKNGNGSFFTARPKLEHVTYSCYFLGVGKRGRKSCREACYVCTFKAVETVCTTIIGAIFTAMQSRTLPSILTPPFERLGHPLIPRKAPCSNPCPTFTCACKMMSHLRCFAPGLPPQKIHVYTNSTISL